MSATTAADLFARAHHLALVLRDSHDPITLSHWEQFDLTLYRVLHETLGVDSGHVRLRDPSRTMLRSALRTYPAPPRPPTTTAARAVAVSEAIVRRELRAGQPHIVRAGEAAVRPARALDQGPGMAPADPADPHPLARLAVTLGALADQLNDAHHTGQPVLETPGEAAAAARQLLAIARTAAGRTLAAIPYADADRPLAIAQYTERVLDLLTDATTPPVSLDRLRTVTTHPGPQTPNDRLEAALHAWAGAARADLGRPIPATDSIRFLANQAVHLYALTHHVITADQRDGLDPDGATTAALTAAARAARAVDPLWTQVTTLARPTLEYVTASRNLIPVLDDVSAALTANRPHALDTRRALADLTHTTTSIADLMATTRTLPDRLARSQLLHTPKDRTTVIDLHSRRRLLTRLATPDNAAHLAKAWTHAGTTARGAATQLHHTTATQAEHPLNALTPIERTL